MEYPVEEILSYPLPALFVLAVFYGIYFAKMLAQKRRGIPDAANRTAERKVHSHSGTADEHGNAGRCDCTACDHSVWLELPCGKRSLYRFCHRDAR